jgi:putative DNA primase/helicase
MTLDEAISQACAQVGIVPPQGRIDMNKWVKADTTSGKNGKGDGRVICDHARATAMNWQTGESVTVWLNEQRSPEEKRQYAEHRREADKRSRDKALRAAKTAEAIIAAAQPGQHPYLARKGFAAERPLIIGAGDVARIGGDYLVPEGGHTAIVVPARIGLRVASVQLIWSDGTKKFLFGGDMGGATHRIASGRETWLCEGYATGLSLRAALKGLNRRDTILVCFSASNIAKVAQHVEGRKWVCADHDAPPKAKPDQFDGMGAGEFYALKTGAPYIMPPAEGMDINDMHQAGGIFAVQRLIGQMMREVKM